MYPRACFLVLIDHHKYGSLSDAYPTQHLIYAWKSMPGVVVLDKEMAQFYMKDMTTAVQRVAYVAGELNCEPTAIHIAFQLFLFASKQGSFFLISFEYTFLLRSSSTPRKKKNNN